MRRIVLTVCGLGLLAGSAMADDPAPATQPKSLKEKVSYGIGLNIGRRLQADELDVDANLLVRGIRDGISDGKPLLTDEEIREAMVQFQQQLEAMEEQREAELAKKNAEAGAKNARDGKAFLDANKKKAGVTTTESGLQYEVVKKGDGVVPKATDVVVAHYRGTLIDGTEFDSSYSRGEPATFPVGNLIKGWTEALQLMPVGSKWRLVVPAELAYGERGAGGVIGPNSVLVFDIELLSIEKQQ